MPSGSADGALTYSQNIATYAPKCFEQIMFCIEELPYIEHFKLHSEMCSYTREQ